MNIKVYWVLYWKVKDITLHLMQTFPILTVLNTYVSVCSNIDRYDMPIKIKQVNYSTSQNTLWHNFDHETDLIPFIESYISHWTLGSSRWFDYFQYIVYVMYQVSSERMTNPPLQGTLYIHRVACRKTPTHSPQTI